MENVCCHSLKKKPKALLEINHKSLLENHIDTLIRLGFKNIVVNAFHLSEQIVEKIAQGKLQKFFKDNTLLNQQFVKDNSLTIKNYLSSFSSDLTIESFIRISIG